MTDASPTVTGHVVRDDAGRLWVDVPRRSACQSCGKSSACGMSVLGGLSSAGSIRLNADGLAEGASVDLACPSSGLLKAAFLAYGLPALGLVGGAVSMAVLEFGDGVQALGAGLGLVLAIILTRRTVARGHLPTLSIYEE